MKRSCICWLQLVLSGKQRCATTLLITRLDYHAAPTAVCHWEHRQPLTLPQSFTRRRHYGDDSRVSNRSASDCHEPTCLGLLPLKHIWLRIVSADCMDDLLELYAPIAPNCLIKYLVLIRRREQGTGPAKPV